MSSNEQAVDRLMLVAQSALNSATAFQPRTAGVPQQGIHHHISWGTGVVSGAVTIECADVSTYAGTWAPIAVITFSGTAPNQDYAYTPGRPKAIRHRISTVLAGGTVSTSIVGSL